jgi:hypothetical protein
MAERNTSTPASNSDDAVSGSIVPKVKELDAQFHAFMLARAQRNSSERSEEVMLAQGQAILTAESVDDIWRADMGGTVQVKDAPGLEVEIRSMEPVVSNRQDIDNQHGYYVSMDAVALGGPADVLTQNGLTPGQSFALQTGAELFVKKVRALEAAGAFPVKGVITRITTANGNTVMKLFPMPTRVSSGTAQ